MISKLYEKVVDYIKKEYKFLLLCLLIIVVGVFPLPISLYIGGGIIDLDDRIEVEDEYKENGSFNLSYVKETRATIPTYLLSFIFDWERVNIESVKIDTSLDSVTFDTHEEEHIGIHNRQFLEWPKVIERTW